MLGLIFVTQIVSYPLFFKVEMDNFAAFHDDYVKRISFIAVPVMLAELFISTLVYYNFKSTLSLLLLLLIVLIFLSTFLLQVPIHEKIKFGGRRFLFSRLVNTNWIRTFGWFVKSIISFLIIFEEIL
tara:strand:+ start:736 stop:1116 length:381 start_codon:yes stop_codon:yes gene_type:complete